jgi:hypothetical protein
VAGRSTEAENLVRQAEAQGWTTRRTKHGWLCFPPSGTTAVFVAGTAQDRRSITNSRAQLRRAGLRLG